MAVDRGKAGAALRMKRDRPPITISRNAAAKKGAIRPCSTYNDAPTRMMAMTMVAFAPPVLAGASSTVPPLSAIGPVQMEHTHDPCTVALVGVRRGGQTLPNSLTQLLADRLKRCVSQSVAIAFGFQEDADVLQSFRRAKFGELECSL